jgi:Zn-dependent protease with chaperone function
LNFFEHQDLARRNSRRLLVFFVLSVIAVIAAVDAALWAGWLGSHYGQRLPAPVPRGLFVWGTVLAAGCILLGSMREISRLSAGGESVAELAGGRLVPPTSQQPLERRLLNVVEEMAIASGVRVPKVYVLDDEPGINAFAAGRDVSHAVIGVTRGALERLSRDELQGVIGHEFSHILNGDMALNLRMIGVLAGIVTLGSLGAFIMRRVRGEGKNVAVVFFVGLAIFVIGYSGLFFARLIKAALSRQREFLADASSVQFTRNPDGLCGALDQIRGAAAGARIGARYAEEMSHMFFGQALSLGSLFATHPPLDERIRRINPRFQPAQYRGRREADPGKVAEKPQSDGRRTSDAGIAWGRSPAQSAALVGALDAGKMDHAGELLAALPAGLREALRDPERAAAVVATLLAAAQGEVLKTQLAALQGAGLAEMAAPVRAALPLTQALGQAFHLPVIDLALPALKSAPEAAKKRLLGTLQTLAYADRRVSLHEFVILTLLRYQLSPATRRPPGKRRVSETAGEAGVLIAVIAHAGTRADAAGARGEALDKALSAGARELGIDVALARDAGLSLEAVSAALEAARELAPLEKARLVKGLFAAVTADGVVRVAEAELMRLVGAVLDCPLPPLIENLDPRQLAS